MPTVSFLVRRRSEPSWSVAYRVALSVGALSIGAVLSASCVYTPRPIYRPGGRPPITQTGAVRTDSRITEPDDMKYLQRRRLIIPVVGVQPEDLRNDFYATRGGGRRHNAIDILAPFGTPVIAADDGYVLRLSRNSAGGIVLYATDPEERVAYYYAHLAGYHDGMSAGKALQKGDTIGYVGTSGNAPENTPHLHFQIMRMRGGGRYWNGEPLNPYPLLKNARDAKREAPVAEQPATPQASPRPADPRPDPPTPPVPPSAERP
ncbi:MAG: M23 family metallopeptidase [Gemmatimonadaceae bacterium]